MPEEPRTDRQHATAPADRVRRPYTAPRLTVYGNVVEMTASGSGGNCENGRFKDYGVSCTGTEYYAPDMSNPNKQRS